MFKKNFSSMPVVVGAIIIGFFVWKSFFYFKSEISNKHVIDQAIQDAITDWEKSPSQKLGSEDIFHLDTNAVGNGNSPHIIFIADFLCTDCMTVFEKLEKLSRSGKISFTTYFYPIDNHCNSNIHYRSDGLGCQLAAAVMCAEATAKKGLELTQLLFAENKNIVEALAKGPEILQNQLTKLSLDKTAIDKCVESPAVKTQIKLSVDSIKNINFSRLPVILYKDKVYNAALIDSGIEDLLEKNP